MVEGTLSFDMTESTKKRNRILRFKAECGVGLSHSRLLLNSRTVIHKDKGPWLFRILIQCLLMSNKTVLNELVTTILFKNTFKPLGNVTSQDGSVTEGFWRPSVQLPGPYMKSWPTSSACLGQSSTLLGPGGLFQPSRISLVEKKKVKQHCWFGVRPGGRSLRSHVDLDEGWQTEPSKIKENGILRKPSFVSL